MVRESKPDGSAKTKLGHRAFATARGLQAIGVSLSFGSAMIAGVVVGSATTLLVLSIGPEFMNWSVAVGGVTGIVCFLCFALIRALFRAPLFSQKRPTGSESLDNSPLAILASTAGEALARHDPKAKAAVEEIARQLPGLARSGISAATAFWGASTSLALGVTVAGAVVSMSAVIAAYRQVERMDQQNRLIEQQIFEATATRISSVFAAQLPALLQDLDKSRASNPSRDWEVEPSLVARIQALINGTQPYSVDEQVNAWKKSILERESRRAAENFAAKKAKNVEPDPYPLTTDRELFAQPTKYSPERGQLLILLIAANFPFEKLPAPLDFSFADLRNLRLGPSSFTAPTTMFDLGETILKGANLRNANLSGIDFSRSDLRGAVLPRPQSLTRAIFFSLPSRHRSDVRAFDWFLGAKLESALVDISDAASRLQVIENSVNFLGSWEKEGARLSLHRLWPFEDYTFFFRIGEAPFHSDIVSPIQDLLRDVGAVGGVSLPPDKCNTQSLPHLQPLKDRLGATRRSDVVAFAKIILADLDEETAKCVFGATARR